MQTQRKSAAHKPRSTPPAVRPEHLSPHDLFDLYAHKIHALARRLTNNDADADDLTQETFTQAVRKWGGFQGRSDPGTWLYTIAVRIFRRKLRRKKGHERSIDPTAELMPFRDRGVADLPSDALPAVSRILDREALRALEAAITRLPAPFRVPIILKDILELDLDQVADILDLQPQTAKTRIHRARLALRQEVMRHVDQRPAPDPTYPKQVCVDLLRAKLDAMDKGRGFPIKQDVICDRCRSVFAELDLTQNACAALATGDVPARLRKLIGQLPPG